MIPPPTVEEEARRILAFTGDPLRAFDLVEKQMSVLVLRTQVMLSLSGIVITVTGFSGRAVAETGALARVTISAGLLIVLSAAAVAIGGVLRLGWVSQLIGDDAPLDMLIRAIRLRERKGTMLSLSLRLFVLGFALYCFAVAQLIVATPTR